MTAAQKAGVREAMGSLGARVLTHGDCLGADAEAHAIAVELGVRVRIRPANVAGMRAYCSGGEVVAGPEAPLVRNRRIVDDGEVLIAAPGMMQEQRRSGVWATIRYAMKQDRRIVIVWPDGQVERR